jgi:hypothetical protein
VYEHFSFLFHEEIYWGVLYDCGVMRLGRGGNVWLVFLSAHDSIAVVFRAFWHSFGGSYLAHGGIL